MTWPPATRKDHDTFCRVEEWTEVRNARGRTGTHHVTYELGLPDGRILRTRISHPVNRTDYGPRMWKHILRDQLQVEEDEFWVCVNDGIRPNRGMPERHAESLPVDLVRLLIVRVGLSEAEVASMSKDEAIARIQRHWTEGR
ncbi:cytotoxic translational repressor of toxin-antitoxin stability system [Saccharopolyspora antimicrobica]|uniref:cytotoxic translational repressor of toxin-antitoxin stability system n=1 Tax=Saccharopolyspora antimicrobica TaxID=455193 RepID=UPI000B804960|nr:cytotoxic translational repressor of toxin-antitoxin stability system [Saccharopolyspora antimicrobica]